MHFPRLRHSGINFAPSELRLRNGIVQQLKASEGGVGLSAHFSNSRRLTFGPLPRYPFRLQRMRKRIGAVAQNERSAARPATGSLPQQIRPRPEHGEKVDNNELASYEWQAEIWPSSAIPATERHGANCWLLSVEQTPNRYR
jgi:hypothetical protein